MPTVLTTTANKICTVTINRPEARNALNDAVLMGLIQAFNDADYNPDVKVVVLTGAGDKAFCAGGDLGKFGEDSAGQETGQKSRFVQLFTRMFEMQKPIIARVNGPCLAGGFGLALACDMIYASERSIFGTPEIKVGLWPMMISAILYRDMSRKQAHDLMYTGRTLRAEEGVQWGFVNQSVPADELDNLVQETAATLASRSAAVLGLGRKALSQSMDMAYLEALRYLQDQLGHVLATEDAMEGIQAFFEKREPDFKDR